MYAEYNGSDSFQARGSSEVIAVLESTFATGWGRFAHPAESGLGYNIQECNPDWLVYGDHLQMFYYVRHEGALWSDRGEIVVHTTAYVEEAITGTIIGYDFDGVTPLCQIDLN